MESVYVGGEDWRLNGSAQIANGRRTIASGNPAGRRQSSIAQEQDTRSGLDGWKLGETASRFAVGDPLVFVGGPPIAAGASAQLFFACESW
jgi:hypothetical protein